MRIEIKKGVLTRVFPSSKRPGRVYVDIIDLESNGGRFSLTADNVDFAGLKASEGKMGSMSGEFEVFVYEQKMQFKGVSVVWKDHQPDGENPSKAKG